ncbi:vera protein [Xylariaceae sp. FL0016]|nr:vera protein [Xylariaceae sp. FL0016]
MALNFVSPIVWKGIGTLILLLVGKFLYGGYITRSRVRAMKAQGIPILPHSLLFGHLPIFADFRAENPPDSNIYNFHKWIIENCKRYWPDRNYPPTVVYIDMWPIVDSLAMVMDPAACAQFTQTNSLPKPNIVKQFLEPLTAANDIVSTDGQVWKTWRSRFNPGFSQRNLTTLLPEILEEMTVFVQILRDLAGEDGKWGPVFQLEERTTNLTFDIICRAVLDLRLQEQTSSSQSSSLKVALLDQIKLMGMMANASRGLPIGRLPWHRAAIIRNNRDLRNILLPQIQKKLQADGNDVQKKTVVDLAIKYVDKDDPSASKQKPNAEFIDRLISNLKAFLFAGHDTTASTICFMTKELIDHPECLAKVQAEHDAIFGKDPEKAAEALASQPHLLHSLPYTLGVCKETLRLHPLAATIRECDESFCLTGRDGMTFPMAGFGAWLSPHGCQRHPDYWPRPNDFLPERWLTGEGDPMYPAKEAYTPFSVGPRNCIGMELALMELKLVLVLTSRTFEFQEAWDEWDKKQGARATPSHKVKGQRSYGVGNSTVHSKDGMPVHVRLRD